MDSQTIPQRREQRQCAGRILLAAFGFAALWLLRAPAASASVALSAAVVQGGLDLDFGTLSRNEPARTLELDLTLASTGSAQYRLYQEVAGGLVNERGERMPDGALVMQMTRGTTGRRGIDGTVAVSDRLQELFISDAVGTSDTVRVVYTILPVPGLAAGAYQGLLRFTVESLDTRAIVTQTVRLRATVGAVFQLERRGGSERIDFGEVTPGERSAEQGVDLAVVANTQAPIQLLQELAQPLASPQGATIPAEALLTAVATRQGQGAWRPVRMSPEALLTDDRGTLRELRLLYATEIPAAQTAGHYRGTLRLQLMQPGTAAMEQLLLPVEAVVRDVFLLSVRPEDGSDSLQFTRGGLEPVERRMVVEIRTNLARPYEVSAGLDHALVLKSGETLPPEALVWSATAPQRGQVLIGPGSPVSVGYRPLYHSDAAGSPDTFVLSWRLQIPPEAKSGLYSGQLRFTITMF